MKANKTIAVGSADEMDGWTNGWLDGWMDGEPVGWTDGWTATRRQRIQSNAVVDHF